MGREARIAVWAAVGAVTLLALVAVKIALGQDTPAPTVATVGADPIPGRRVVVTCNSIGSVAVTTTTPPPYTNATRWTAVRGSQRAEPCPAEQEFDNAFAFPTERWRNYVVSVRLRVYALDGTLLVDRYPAPYYYFENGLAKPAAPIVGILTGT